MSRKVPVRELLVIAAVIAGCSSSTKSGLSGDGSTSSPDSARYGGESDVAPSDAARGTIGWDSADGKSNGDLGQSMDTAGPPWDTGGSEAGSRDAPKVEGDTPLQLVDGAPGFDVPNGSADLARPGPDASSVRDVSDARGGSIPDLGQGDTVGVRYDSSSPYLLCDLGPSFKMPADQLAVPDNHGMCMPPAGKSMSDVGWLYGMPSGKGTIAQDGLKVLSSVTTCTDFPDGGDASGSPAGTPIKAVLAVESGDWGPGDGVQRLFAIYEDSSGTRVQAVYDLTFIQTKYKNGLPPYPQPYFRLSPACGSADAIPFLKGWTGRIGLIRPPPPTTYIRPNGERYSRSEVVLWGSAEGESQTRAFSFTNEQLMLP